MSLGLWMLRKEVLVDVHPGLRFLVDNGACHEEIQRPWFQGVRPVGTGQLMVQESELVFFYLHPH